MADTGEDEEITLDTMRIRGAVRYLVGHDEVAPGTRVYFATDGEARVPAQSEDHARDLASAMTLVELEHFGSRGWLSIARRATIRLVRWLNRQDVRTQDV